MSRGTLTKQEILEAAYQWVKSTRNHLSGVAVRSKDTDIIFDYRDILECLQDLIKEEKVMSLADDYNTAMRIERDEAVNLLTAVCDFIDSYPASHCKYLFEGSEHRISGLKEWWAARRPKSEREQKLEKIQKVIKTWWPDGMDSPQARMSEEILNAIEP